MKNSYHPILSVILLVFFSFSGIKANYFSSSALLQQCDTILTTAHFSLDDCEAIGQFAGVQYDEFTADVDNNPECTTIEVIGGSLYRQNPADNKHSCTPGVDGTNGMCIGAEESCEFEADSEKALRIDLRVTPSAFEQGNIDIIRFYEQAPDEYVFTTGQTGPNNAPQFFGIRIVKNGTEIYRETDIPTNGSWTAFEFDFGENDDFLVTEETVFNIELLPYCSQDNGGSISVWDVEEISIISDCSTIVVGGELELADGGTEIEICAGDGVPDPFDVVITNNEGPNFAWVITDSDLNILGLPDAPPFDLEGAGGGVCLIWGLSFDDGLLGAELGANAGELDGCFELTNPITVIRNGVNGGEITLDDGSTEIEICAGDGVSDAFDVVLTGEEGENAAWVITDEDLNILAIQDAPPFDLEGAGGGVCLIWHLRYHGEITGAEVGANAADLEGCFDLSNAITVIRNGVNGGEITLDDGSTEIEICAGDGVSDAFNVNLAGEEGESFAWVITDSDLNILDIPAGPPFDLEGAGGGVCLIWHLSYHGEISGAEVGANAADLEGCYDLSNEITVTRNPVNGGEISSNGSTEVNACPGDENADLIDVTLEGAEGENSAWVITDEDLNILDLPAAPPFDFEGAGEGVCLIWHLSFHGEISGAEVGANAADLEGCFNLSNSITVTRKERNGGIIVAVIGGTDIEICAGDGIPDPIDIVLENNIGDNSSWVITDEELNILDLPVEPPFDFEGAGGGVCLIWHMSSNFELTGVEIGANAADIEGCYELSNAITVVRNGVNGGILTLSDGTIEVSTCSGDGNPDLVEVSLTETEGENSAWVITDEELNILDLPAEPPFDFEDAGEGVCLIWHLSFHGEILGAEVGANAADLQGCFDLSDPITVIRTEVNGGQISLEDGSTETEVCAGDGAADPLDVTLEGTIGANVGWIITDTSGMILDLPMSPPFDFEGAGGGVCLIWNISYEDGLVGLEVDSLASGLEGCFALSNPITVTRNGVNGGEIGLSDGNTEVEICAGDGLSDAVDVVLDGAEGENSAWVITDEALNILDLPAAPPFDFEGAGEGVCLIWHLSFHGEIEGAAVDSNAANLAGCFNLSNAITVTRTGVGASMISNAADTTDVAEFCVDDGVADTLNVNTEGGAGANSAWIVTDSDGNILALPEGSTIDFEGSGGGTCLVWQIHYADGLEGLEVDSSANNLMGCFALSNPITVTRNTGESCGSNFNSEPGNTTFRYNVMPNPSNDYILIRLQAPESEEEMEAEVQIFDMYGNLIIKRAKGKMENELRINVHELRPGKYFIRLLNESGAGTQSFVIVR